MKKRSAAEHLAAYRRDLRKMLEAIPAEDEHARLAEFFAYVAEVAGLGEEGAYHAFARFAETRGTRALITIQLSGKRWLQYSPDRVVEVEAKDSPESAPPAPTVH